MTEGTMNEETQPRGEHWSPLPVEILAEPPWQRRHPVVLDTSVLIADVLKRSGTTFTGLTYLGQHNIISIVAPRHVEEEVFRKLPKAALDTKRDPAQVLATLRRVHLPLVRFVDLPAELPQEDGVMQVAQRDPTDAPLAHLTALLSPCLVLSTDKDLTDLGYGSDGWLADVLLLGDLAELDDMVWGGGMLAYASVAAPTYGLWKLLTLMARSKVGLGVSVAAVVGALIWFGPQLQALADRTAARVLPVVEDTVRSAGTVLDRRARIEATYRSRLALPTGPPSLESATARHLVTRGRPVASELLHAELGRRGHGVTLHQLQTLLRSHPAFIGERGKGYQLGALSERILPPEVITAAARDIR